VWVAWHLKGAAGTLHEWRKLTGFERSVIVAEVARRIEIHNEAFED